MKETIRVEMRGIAGETADEDFIDQGAFTDAALCMAIYQLLWSLQTTGPKVHAAGRIQCSY